MNNNQGIGRRLTEFGQKKFGTERGWKTRFSEALGVRPQDLNRYIAEKNSIGNIVQDRLRALGCDIEWLMTGVRKEAEVQKSDVDALRERLELLEMQIGTINGRQSETGDKDVLIEILSQHNLDDPDKLRRFLLASKARSSVAHDADDDTITERFTTDRKLREKDKGGKR